MTKPFSFTHEFVLDRAYFEQTYDASVDAKLKAKDFVKAGVFALAGLAILMGASTSEQAMDNKNLYYLGYFFVGLGVVEALSVKFRRTWWLWRQMMSKAANNSATLTINDDGIYTKSNFVDATLLWADIYRIEEKPQGYLIQLKAGKSYLSKRGLSDAAITFIQQKMQ